MIKSNLDTLNKSLKSILTREGSQTISQISNDLWAKLHIYTNNPEQEWTIEFPESTPITFRRSTVQNDIYPEFFGYIKGPGGNGPNEAWPVSEYQIVVRLWSENPRWNYWKWADNPDLEKLFCDQGERRLVLALRFEHEFRGEKRSIEPHPWYHMHIGAESEKDVQFTAKPTFGYYRHPHEIHLPRIAVMPMDFLLAARLITATFFPEHYREIIRNDSEWRTEIASTEQLLWTDYCKSYRDFLANPSWEESCFDRMTMESTLVTYDNDKPAGSEP